MLAVNIKSFGGPEQLELIDLPAPQPGPEEIIVDVYCTALNRADLLQRAGRYPPQADESPILGLEMAGVVKALGSRVQKWKIGDRVCGLLGGGGYAAQCKIHQDMALPIPNGLTYQQAAAIPEVFLTAFQALHWIGKIEEQDRVLIHAGASGVGTAAIQLAALVNAHIIVTASKAKHQLCFDLGAKHCIDYHHQSFVEVVKKITEEEGVNVLIDFIGAPYFTDNLNCLALDGRMVMLAFLGGAKLQNDLNLATLLRKRIQVTGSTLRLRSMDYKIQLSKALQAYSWPHFEQGKLRPIIDSVFPIEQVVAAHQRMEANLNSGKIILELKPEHA